MSLLGSQVFANPSTPLWASASGGGGGPTGPTGPIGPTGPSGGGTGTSILSQTLQYTVPASNDGATGPQSTGVFLTRPLNEGIPALDGSGNSTVISGLGVNLSTYDITCPTGTYQFSGYACETMTSGQMILQFSSPGSNAITGPTVGADNRTYACPVQGSFNGPATFQIQTYGEQSIGDGRDWGTGNVIGPSTFVALTLTKIA